MLVDQSVVQNWHEASIPTDMKTLIGIGKNIIKIKESLPKTSTSQTAILNSAIEGICFLFFYFILLNTYY